MGIHIVVPDLGVKYVYFRVVSPMYAVVGASDFVCVSYVGGLVLKVQRLCEELQILRRISIFNGLVS